MLVQIGRKIVQAKARLTEFGIGHVLRYVYTNNEIF
jgi:hypothetical protein